jgi:uncharacterized protein YrrD
LRKAKDVLGLPVVSVDSGKRVGTVKDITVGPDWLLKAVVLEARSWFSAGKSVSAHEIVGFGGDAVTIAAERAAQPCETVPQARPLFDGAGRLLGLPVLTVGGTRLGTIEDVYFYPNRGIPIVGFELSEGFLTDLQEGRKLFALPERTMLGEDAVVVPNCCLTDKEYRFVTSNIKV